MYNFGAGMLFAVPTIDITGVAITTPTPVQFGIIQDVSLEFTRGNKELYGQYAFPAAVGAGTGKMNGKAKYGLINGALLNMMFGATPATGERKVIRDEVGTVPGSSSYIITTAQNATWVTDLGVKYALTGLPLARGVTASAAGIYSVAAGVYTFHADDKSLGMLISYLYTTAVAPGKVFTVSNPYLGQSLYFKIVWNGSYQGQQCTFELLRCIASKLTFATKLDDFTIPEFDFSAMADDAGNLYTVSVHD